MKDRFEFIISTDTKTRYEATRLYNLHEVLVSWIDNLGERHSITYPEDMAERFLRDKTWKILSSRPTSVPAAINQYTAACQAFEAAQLAFEKAKAAVEDARNDLRDALDGEA